MAASISSKQKNVSMEVIKRTAGYIAGATGGYISEVMPTTGSTISEAKNSLQELNSTFANLTNSIVPGISKLKNQGGFKVISNWFMQKENDFDDTLGEEASLDFDVESDNTNSEIVEAQISESVKNANKISKTVVETSHKMVEAQLTATANILSSVDKQTAIISSGFDKTNETLNKILEVLVKNTTTMIETSIASMSERNSQSSSNDYLASRGKFDLGIYKNMVLGNFKNSQAGMAAGMLSMLSGMKGMITPETVIQYGISSAMDKFSPKLKENMASLDSAVNDVIMGSLIRLGEHKNESGLKGTLAQLFGIDSTKQEVYTGKASLELKSVSFDSVTKEAIVGALPGYMRHILVALGGPDLIYDYKSRSFKTKTDIKKEFRDKAISPVKGSLYRSDGNIVSSLGTDKFTSMIYDLMINDLGNKVSNGEARSKVSKFSDANETQEYILNTVLDGVKLSPEETEAAKQFASNLGKLSGGMDMFKIMDQVSKSNISRNSIMDEHVNSANLYGMDLSYIRDSKEADRKALLESYGKSTDSSESKISINNPNIELKGTNYTNMALYEIFRRLNEGINVFQVGSYKKKKSPYAKFGEDILVRPFGYKPKQTKSEDGASISHTGSSGFYHDDGSANALQNNTLDDGNIEDLSKGERLARWGKQRGGNLAKAMFSGNSEQVKEAFGLIVRDITEVGGTQIKKGLQRVNDSFGNVSGFLKHKLFGKGYSYDSGETDKDGNPIRIHVQDNKYGGLSGLFKDEAKSMFSGTKASTMKWFKDVSGYFDYGDVGNQSPDEKKIQEKRKRFLSASVGAMAGAGLLGGPMGLIFGAVAGNALSVNNIGSSIKKSLFGEDYEDNKGRKKHKLGLLERAVNGVVDPFKYQLGKTFNAFGKTMKKSILGPLSDVGAAIKDRITNTAGEVSKSYFGKALAFIGNMIMAPFKGALSLAKFPITIAGSMTRGVMESAGGAIGGGLSLGASLIAGKTRKDEEGNIIGGRGLISSRREERNKKIDEDYKNDYTGYKEWKSNKDESRRNRWKDAGKYTEETEVVQSEIAESNKAIEEHSAETAEATATLARLGSEEGSIFTHDAGIHERIDEMIKMMGGMKKSTKSTAAVEDDKNFINSVISATGSMMSADGVVSNEESRLGTSIIDEATRAVPNKTSVISRFKNLIGIQSKRKENEDGNRENSLLSLFKQYWVPILGILSTISGDIAENVLEAGKRLWQHIKGDGKDNNDKDDSNAPLNAVTSVADMRTNNASDYVNPLANIYHVQEDATGDDIINTSATNAKDAAWRHLGYNVTKGSLNYLNNTGIKANYQDKAMNAKMSGRFKDYAQYSSLSEKFGERANASFDSSFGKTSAKVGKGLTSLGVGLFGGQWVGKKAGELTSSALQDYGMPEQLAGIGGRIVETGATIAGTYKITKSAIKKDGYINGIMESAYSKMKELLQDISSAISKNKFLSRAAKPVKEFLGKVISKLNIKMIMPFSQKISALMAKTAVGSTGIGAGVFAGYGAIAGACNPENLFGVSSDDADWLMRIISAALGAVFNLPYICLIEILDIIAVPIYGKSIRQYLAEIIYNTLSRDGGAELSVKQNKLDADAIAYNKQFGTNLDKVTYNDLVNQGVWDKLWTGGTKTDATGRAMFDEKGNRLTNGGLSDIKDKAINEYTYAKNMVTEFWDGKNLLGADGKELKDEKGNVIKQKDGLKQWAFKSIGGIITSLTDTIDAVEEGTDEYLEKGSIWVKNKYSNSKEWASNTIKSIWTPIHTSFTNTTDAIANWNKKDSPWAKYKSVQEWISSILNSFYDSIISGATAIVDTAKDWAGGAKDKVVNGAKTLWNKGANYAKSWLPSYFNNPRAGVGGPLDGALDNAVDLSSLGGIKSGSEGKGNPLNKTFEVTSPFSGSREHPVYGGARPHKGIDIAPTDGSGEAQVGAVYAGKVTAVGYQEGGAGNFVFYETPDGMTVKNMHLKDNSIPSNIKQGATIKPGDKIGDMGSTGASTGPHLHYQLERDGKAFDPADAVKGGKTYGSFVTGDSGSSSSSSSDSKSSSPAGPLAALIGSFTDIGTKFLNSVTGGLFGSSSNDNKDESGSSGKSGSSTGTSTFSGLTGTDTPEKVYNFLRSKGCSHAAAIGILANMHQESGIDPTREQIGGPAKGIVQWEGGRLEELRNFAASKKRSWTDLETQLEFMWSELSSDDIDMRMKGGGGTSSNITKLGYDPHPQGFAGFKSLNDPKYATALFEGAFERAGLPMMENRYGAIPALEERLGKQNPTGKKKGTGGSLEELFSGLKNNIKSNISGKIRDVVSNSNNMPNRMSLPGILPSNTRTPNIVKSPDIIPKISLPTVQASSGVSTSMPSAINNNSSDSVEKTTPSGIGVLESLLIQVLAELKSINGNTGESSTLLEALNKKDFVDVGVRESINQLGKVSAKQRKPQAPTNYGSTRSISAMIRP